MKPEDMLALLEREAAPVALSDELCAKYGAYDNSGLILDCEEEVSGALFALDLTESVVNEARERRFNLIVTHHPAIYAPVKSISVGTGSPTAAVAKCMRAGISVISMHLNFDAAPRGIDGYLAEGLGAVAPVALLEPLSGGGGYGRVSAVREQSFGELRARVESEFCSGRCRFYPVSRPVKRVASFCGAGCDEAAIAFAAKHGADVFVSADMKHHHIAALLSLGMGVIEMTHYASEIYGFSRIYGEVGPKLGVPSEISVRHEFI